MSDPGLGYTAQVIGLRFLDVAIPAGARVEEAYLEFTTDEVSTTPTLTIQAEASDNAPEFVLAQNNVSSRTRTGASVAWSDVSRNLVGQRHPSPDISSVVQAMVSRSGWRPGNALALIVTGTGTRTAESYNGSVSGAPKLIVRYTSSSNPPPTTTNTIRLNFEGGRDGFSTNPSGSDTATIGRWQRANPEQSSYNSYIMQLDAVAEGQYALVTDGRAGTSVGSYDVDVGVTTIRSPTIDLRTASSASVSLAYYLAHLNNSSADDFSRIKVVGTATVTLLEERGAANHDNASWQSANYLSLEFKASQKSEELLKQFCGNPKAIARVRLQPY